MRGKWLFVAIAALLTGAGAILFTLHRKALTPPPARTPNTTVTEAAPEVTLTGKLRPRHLTSVKADIEGDVDSFMVDAGENVIAGQILAQVGSSRLESQRESATAAASAAEAQLSRAESNLANARLEASRADADGQRARAALDKAQEVYDRQEMLNKVGATPRLTWEKAQRDLQNAQQEYDVKGKAVESATGAQRIAADDLATAQKTAIERKQELAEARDNMQTGEVHSPVDGIVMARNGEAGKRAGEELFEIATDMSALEVALEAPPAVRQRLRPGDPAKVSIPGLQNASFTGRIREIQDDSVIVEFNCTLPGIRQELPVEVHLKLQ